MLLFGAPSALSLKFTFRFGTVALSCFPCGPFLSYTFTLTFTLMFTSLHFSFEGSNIEATGNKVAKFFFVAAVVPFVNLRQEPLCLGIRRRPVNDYANFNGP